MRRHIPTCLIALTMIFVMAPYPLGAFEQMTTQDGLPISHINTSCFKYTLNAEGSKYFEFAEVREMTRWSFDVWESVECSYFYFEETEESHISEANFHLDQKNLNLIVWRQNADDWDYGGTEIAMTSMNYDANTGRILDVDIEFNEHNYTFANEDSYGYPTVLIDFKNTLVHEIGHTVGLAHTGDPESTMYPEGPPGETKKRTLEQDDIDGICHIYPLEDDPGTCIDPYCGLGISPDDLACEDSDDSGCGCVTAGVKTGRRNRVSLFTVLLHLAGH